MIYELNHFGIAIKNLDVSLAFYQNVLGAKIVYQGLIPANNTDVVYLLISGGLIELLHTPGQPDDAEFGINHIAFMSNDLDADYAGLIDAGYKGLVAPKPAGSGVGRLAFLSDPNGARVELIERDLKMREHAAEHDIIKSFDHYSIYANNLSAAREFYTSALGMGQLAKIESHGEVQSYLNYDYDVLELYNDTKAENASEIFRHFALRVVNVRDAISAFAKQDVVVETCADGDVTTASIFDPDGVRIQILERPDLH